MSALKIIAPPSAKEILALKATDSVPPGWFSRRELEKVWNMSTAQTSALTRLALEAGKAKSKEFRIITGSRTMKVPHYKFK